MAMLNHSAFKVTCRKFGKSKREFFSFHSFQDFLGWLNYKAEVTLENCLQFWFLSCTLLCRQGRVLLSPEIFSCNCWNFEIFNFFKVIFHFSSKFSSCDDDRGQSIWNNLYASLIKLLCVTFSSKKNHDWPSPLAIKTFRGWNWNSIQGSRSVN